jgi:hypothetical protein
MKFHQTMRMSTCILVLFFISGCYPKNNQNNQNAENAKTTLEEETILSHQDALNIVKQYIDKGDTAVFEAFTIENGCPSYYFKNSNYKIQYCESYLEDNNVFHLIQQCELVIDDEDSMEGHTATSNWYKVDDRSGRVIPQFDENGDIVDEF